MLNQTILKPILLAHLSFLERRAICGREQENRQAEMASPRCTGHPSHGGHARVTLLPHWEQSKTQQHKLPKGFCKRCHPSLAGGDGWFCTVHVDKPSSDDSLPVTHPSPLAIQQHLPISCPCLTPHYLFVRKDNKHSVPSRGLGLLAQDIRGRVVCVCV